MSLLKRAQRAGVFPVVRHAAVNTVNLVVAGVAGVAAATLHSLPVLALGGLAYAAMVAWDSMNPAFQKKVRGDTHAAQVDLSKLLAHSDERARHFAEALVEGRAQRAKALDDVPAAAEQFIAGSMSQVPDLEAHAKLLIDRLVAVRDHLSHSSPADVRDELAALKTRAAQASDPEARDQLNAAASAKQSQLATLEDLQRTAERIEAHLTNILSVLEGVPAKLLHMRTLDDSNRDAFSSDIKGDLARLDAELSAFEETLKPVGIRSPA